ncbi:MAG: hypothetical protein ACMG6H_10000 [Acidobacteriota bacterium]
MKPLVLAGAALLPLLASLSFASPQDYVFTPAVTYGERELDFKVGSAKKPDEDRTSAASLGFGYGLTQSWMTELYVKYNREAGSTRSSTTPGFFAANGEARGKTLRAQVEYEF